MIAIGYVGFVGFNLIFDVHKKPDSFTLLNHYTVIMTLAFRMIVTGALILGRMGGHVAPIFRLGEDEYLIVPPPSIFS